MRTIATKEFDEYVESVLAVRQEKIFESKHQIIGMLPEFAEKLANSKLFSSIFFTIFQIKKLKMEEPVTF